MNTKEQLKTATENVPSITGNEARNDRPITVIVNGKQVQCRVDKYGRMKPLTAYRDIEIKGVIPIDNEMEFEIVKVGVTPPGKEEHQIVSVRQCVSGKRKKDGKDTHYTIKMMAIPMNQKILSLIAKHMEELSREAN